MSQGKIQVIGTNEIVQSTPNVLISKINDYPSSQSGESPASSPKEKKKVFVRKPVKDLFPFSPSTLLAPSNQQSQAATLQQINSNDQSLQYCNDS